MIFMLLEVNLAITFRNAGVGMLRVIDEALRIRDWRRCGRDAKSRDLKRESSRILRDGRMIVEVEILDEEFGILGD
jgi:hypothetical protein